MKAYLAGPIFTERDRNFNSYLEEKILERCPDMDLYLAQNNTAINDKTKCANSADIYVGDISRLKEADILITIMSGDLPPIGSSYEVAYFCGLCEHDDHRRIIALYDDNREGNHTYLNSKKDAMVSDIAENQWPYINLLSIGFVKKWGNIYNNSDDFIDAIVKEYEIGIKTNISGIYKITDLSNYQVYIGQSVDIHNRWQYYKRGESSLIGLAIQNKGLNYFKFEIIEKCQPEFLDDREKFWIEYYDSYNNGYNQTSGGSGDKNNMQNIQSVPIYSYNLDGTFEKEYISIALASRDCGLKSSGDISRCAALEDSIHKSGEKMWRYYKVDHIEPYEPPYRGMAVYAYHAQTREFVKGYKSMVDAGQQLTGKRQSHITDVCNGKRLTCLGFIWAYDYFDRLPDDYFKKISQKTIEGEFK